MGGTLHDLSHVEHLAEQGYNHVEIYVGVGKEPLELILAQERAKIEGRLQNTFFIGIEYNPEEYNAAVIYLSNPENVSHDSLAQLMLVEQDFTTFESSKLLESLIRHHVSIDKVAFLLPDNALIGYLGDRENIKFLSTILSQEGILEIVTNYSDIIKNLPRRQFGGFDKPIVEEGLSLGQFQERFSGRYFLKYVPLMVITPSMRSLGQGLIEKTKIFTYRKK